jgi:hypothetical protein
MQRHDHSSQPSVAVGERMDRLELCMENSDLNEPIFGLGMGVAFPCGHQFAYSVKKGTFIFSRPPRARRPWPTMSARVLCRKEECPLFPLPLNPAFEPITLEPEDADALTIVGEFVGTIA